MSVLSDASIRACLGSLAANKLRVTPFDARAVRSASIDLRLGDRLRVFMGAIMDPQADMERFWHDVPVSDDGAWTLVPGRLYLGVTLETISIPNDLAGELFGVSSLGRCGVQVHSTAGWVDPGWLAGRLTLEITVQAAPTLLRPGQRIAQIVLHRMTTPAEHPYGHPSHASKYLGDTEPTTSRFHQEAAP